MSHQDDLWLTSPSGLNFSNISRDPFEPDEMEAALQKLKIGSPAQASFRDSATAEKSFAPFVTTAPPDITKRTRIVAVCGIDPDDASPTHDGWFLSDFCAFWHMFQGLTEDQIWLHCLDLKGLVKQHTYVHGNPFQNRKVVLNQVILETMLKSKHRPRQISPASLKRRLTSAISSAVKAAEKADDNVLIIILAHGTPNKSGLIIGSGSGGIQGATWDLAQLKKSLPNDKVNVAILTSACFSGGWICNPSINVTAFTAASKHKVSKSHCYSGSHGRARGSPWATTIIESFTRDPDTQERLGADVEEFTEEQDASFSHFSYQCQMDLLTKIDRRGYIHGFVFSAQDDDWEASWRARTGFPLGEYRDRWESLPDFGPDLTLHRGDPINRDPGVTDEERRDYIDLRKKELAGMADIYDANPAAYTAAGSILGKRKAMYGGSTQGFLNVVKHRATTFLRSFPGEHTAANDLSMFTRSASLFKNELSAKDIQKLFAALEYRFQDMEIADQHLRDIGISPPNGQLCHQFDFVNYEQKNCDKKNYEQIIEMIHEVGFSILFPLPTYEQGHGTSKGLVYLIAAIDHAGISLEDAKERISQLAMSIKEDVENTREILKRDQEFAAKRQKLYHAFNYFGNVSPRKKISRMMGKGKGFEHTGSVGSTEEAESQEMGMGVFFAE